MSDAKTEGQDEDRRDDEDADHGSSKGGDKESSKTSDEGTSKDDESEDDDDDQDEDQKKDKKPSLFKKPLFWIILIVVVTVLVVGGVLWWLNARQFESTDDAFVDTHIVRIAPQVGGTLVKVANVDNRHVDAGTLLGVIQPSGPEAQLAEAQANVAQSLAQVAQARAQVTAAVAQRNQAAAQSRGPLATAIKADQDLARYQQLAQIDRAAVASQQLDQARATARSTAADARAARQSVASADAQVLVAERQVRAAEAVVGARRAAADQAKVTIGNLSLQAPVAGQVVNRSVNLGSYVGPGTQLMAIIPDNLWITANFKETQLTLMRVGQGVAIEVDAYPGVKFLGHVDSIQRGAGQAFALLPPQNATGNYVKVVQRVPVRLTFDIKNGPDPRHYAIGPGMSVIPTVKVR